jgi:hypothetical protein
VEDDSEAGFGSYVFLGFAIGGITGMAVEAGHGNTFFGFWTGALIGVCLGCFVFIATAVLQSQNRKKHNK